jgi:hypothetical protein
MAKKAEIEKFREQCRRDFRFLEQEYAFAERRLPKEKYINQFQVQYVSRVALVAVEGIHYGRGVDVRLGRVEPEAWEKWRHYGLEDLLQIRCPELSLVGPEGFSVSSDQAFQLKHYAHALKRCADDVLRGDFSVFPRLHEAIERRAQQFSSGEA